LSWFESACAFTDEEALERYQLVPEPPCQKAKLREPQWPDTPYFSERHYLTIDGGKECQILDVWVEPLTKLPYENRRYMQSILYRRKGRLWIKEYGLDYIPKFRLMDKQSSKTYFYVKLDETPFYKDNIVYFNGNWEDKGKNHISVTNIHNIGDCIGEDTERCIQEGSMVRRVVEILKEK
jgi:hypothetical protein